MQGGQAALLRDKGELREEERGSLSPEFPLDLPSLSPESLLDLCMRKLRRGRVGRVGRCSAHRLGR
jgi:hypothetical protein